MILRFSSKSALFAAVSIAAAASGAATASADDAFNGCQEPHWTAFSTAIDSNQPGQIEDFIQTFGPTCTPLRQTAEILLCDLDPASCLQVIEPAAGDPGDVIEQDEPIDEKEEFYTIDRFAERAPGEHIGWENDGGDSDNGGGNDGGGSDTSDSGDSGGGDTGKDDSARSDTSTSSISSTL